MDIYKTSNRYLIDIYGIPMSYLAEFEAAKERTVKFGLMPQQALQFEEGIYMTQDRINELNVRLMPVFKGISSYDQLVSQCLPVHIQAKSIVEDWLGCPVWFTLGWLDDNTGKGIYKFSEENIIEKLQNGHKEKTLNIHGWLTLPTMEIIDLTLSTTISILQGRREQAGGVIAKKAEDVTGFSYKPMLLGKSYLREIDVLFDYEYIEME